jgi:hypothetical protein
VLITTTTNRYEPQSLCLLQPPGQQRYAHRVLRVILASIFGFPLRSPDQILITSDGPADTPAMATLRLFKQALREKANKVPPSSRQPLSDAQYSLASGIVQDGSGEISRTLSSRSCLISLRTSAPRYHSRARIAWLGVYRNNKEE